MSDEKIFIAASESAVAQDISSKLEGMGYIVAGRSAESETTLEKISEIVPDLVLVDFHIKGKMNGVAVAKYINTKFDIPVIFISAQADTITLQSAMPAQAYAFIIKPFEARELKSNIALALYKHGMARQLRESEERYALAVLAANDGIWDWNLRTNEIYFSARWKKMLGYDEKDFGTDPNEWFKLVHPDDKKSVQTNLVSHLKGMTPHFKCEYRMQQADGNFLWVLSRGLAVRDERNIAYRMAGSQSDINSRKLAEERLAHDALHDALTGLPNRVLLLDRLQNRLERTKRNPDHLFAVMFIDLDRFKVVNDSLGHAVGDQLLITVANRLKQCLRPEDTVARLSGDEFSIILDTITDNNDARQVADRIKSKLITTTMLGGVERSPTASIGIVLFNKGYESAEELMRDADSAMYYAKGLGGNRHQVFDTAMHTSAVELIKLEGELKRAVERREWQVHYQPIYSLVSGKPIGAEALVRWLHPQKGILPPSEFIQVAEDTGLILTLGDHVLHTACVQVKAWREIGRPDFWVSVNLSARQFQDNNLAKKISQLLTDLGLTSDALRLEITESVAVRDREYTIRIMNELNAMGIRTSLDDFGTGYSSLSYLKQFPLKILKIDRSFIQDIQVNKNNESLITAIISMAHSLGLEVVAEGVEKDEQLTFLRSRFCDNVQGYLLSRPVTAGDFIKLL